MNEEKVYMKGYKAFKNGLVCDPTGKKPFQFFENTVFEEPEANICERGFHFCEHPLSVLDYYPLFDEDGKPTEFAEVEALDEVQTDDSSKFVTKKIKIGGKLSLKAMIDAEIGLCIEKSKSENTGHYAQGDSGHAAAQGDRGHAAAQGDRGHAAAQGDWGHAAAQGDSGHAAAQGDWGHAAAQGDRGHAAAQGYRGHAAAGGKDAIAAAFGIEGKVKAALDSWIMAAEWYIANDGWHIADVKVAKVDGKKIKADTWYMLKDGEFKEVEK